MRRRPVGVPRYRMTRDTMWAVLESGYLVRVTVDCRPGDLERGPDGRYWTVERIAPDVRTLAESEQGVLEW